jgi:hypothetical protein
MKNRELKLLKAQAIEIFRGLTSQGEVVPDSFATSYTEDHWDELSEHGKLLVAEQIALACEKAMRTRLNEALTSQLELPGPEFEGLPVGIPTGTGGYVGIGMATEGHLLNVIADHFVQIDGHKAAIDRFERLIEDRRSMGIPFAMGYYEWKRGNPGHE